MKHTFARNFLICGLTGWCMEILFTSMDALRRREMTLKGNTSLWMFPIYGSAALLKPICTLLKNRPVWLRGTTYMSLIYSMEYITGRLGSAPGITAAAVFMWTMSSVLILHHTGSPPA